MSEVVSWLSKESHLVTSQAASRRAASFSVLGLADRITALAMVADVHPAAQAPIPCEWAPGLGSAKPITQ